MSKRTTIKEGMKQDLIEAVNQMIEKLFENSPVYKGIKDYVDYEKARKQLFLYLKEHCDENLAKMEAENPPRGEKKDG